MNAHDDLAGLIAAIESISANDDPLPPLILLADQLRPPSGKADGADARWRAVNELLAVRDDLRLRLQNLFLALFTSREQVGFYADAGLLPDSTFGAELRRLAVIRFLPEVPDSSRLRDCFRLIFPRRSDALWLDAISPATWNTFWTLLSRNEEEDRQRQLGARRHLMAAARMLAYRIAAVGLAPEVRRVANLAEGQYPFMALAKAVDAWLSADAEGSAEVVLEAMTHARLVVRRARAAAVSAGTSLTLTYCLERLRESLDRVELLVGLLAPGDEDARRASWAAFMHAAVVGELRRDSIRNHVGQLIRLLALRVTDNASRTGEHYIAESRVEYFTMWRSAMIGGLVIAVMAFLKILIGKLELAPGNQALAYGLNYGLGFMLIQVIGGTVATKQPAMTAATLAGALDGAQRSAGPLDRIATTISGVVRTQTAAILGNVCIALPLALLIGLLLGFGSDGSAVSTAKAHKFLAEIDPWDGPAVAYAAVAGVCLFLAGLISGYVDNVAAYDRIGERVARLGWLRRGVGAARAERVGSYLDGHLGALAGNFLFGMMLGSAGFFGQIFGLPLDIRHIAFSSANVGYALSVFGLAIGWKTALLSALGLALIAAANLCVSFALAFSVALRSRGLRLRTILPLLAHLPGELRRRPGSFLLPPRN